MKVIHVSSVHNRNDARIFYRQCMTLKLENFDVSLIIADGGGSDNVEGISIIDVGRQENRIFRIIISLPRILIELGKHKPEICHLHDPELLILVPFIRHLITTNIIFDSHEKTHQQILNKNYLPKFIRSFLSYFYQFIEKTILTLYNVLVVCATDSIREYFTDKNIEAYSVKNFPEISSLEPPKVKRLDVEGIRICYIGTISEIRGIFQIIEALPLVNSKVVLYLAGEFESTSLREQIIKLPGWIKVIELGTLKRQGVQELLQKCDAGLCTLHPVKNYIDALPVKMFEYMAFGLPVISSNFGEMAAIVQREKCGLTVDPLVPKEIAEAIDTLHSDKHLWRTFCLNSSSAATKTYNWRSQAQELIKIYENFN